MHRRRTISAATLSSLLAVGSIGAITSAQDPEPADDGTTAQGLTGEIVVIDEDGRSVYYLQVGGERIALSFGPSWFTDLPAMFGVEDVEGEVVLDGNLREMSPNEDASATAREKAGTTLKVKMFDGEARPKGKPAWAGGPKEQGAAHPGYGGWSKGEANKEAAQGAKVEAKAAKTAAKAAKSAAKAQAKAARAAAKAQAKAAKAAAKGGRRGD